MTDNLVIFDLDGTLFRTDLVMVVAVSRAAIDLGIETPDRELVLSIGETAEGYVRQLLPNCEADTHKAFLARLRHHEEDITPKVGRLFNGALELLQGLRSDGFTLAVCSNGRQQYVERVLHACHALEFFAHLSGREPEADKTERVKRLIDRTGAGHSVLVGDRLGDLNAARVSGLPCIGVTYGYAPDEARRADLVAATASEIRSLVHLSKIFGRIEGRLRAIQSDHAQVVGINGVDTSGKTTFARRLEHYLKGRGFNTQLIHLDDFHHPKAHRTQGRDAIDAYITNAFDLERLVSELIEPAHTGQTIVRDLDLLNLDTDDHTDHRRYEIGPDSVVLLEGVLLYREPLDQYFDYKVFLDISFEEVLRRAEVRDVPQYDPEFLDRYRSKYIPIQQWYLETHTPLERSDLVIDNNDFHCPRILSV